MESGENRHRSLSRGFQKHGHYRRLRQFHLKGDEVKEQAVGITHT